MPIEKSPNTIYVEHLKKGELAYQFSPGAGKAVVHPGEGKPFKVALIDCDEGFRLMSRVEDTSPDKVKIGQRVRLRVHTPGGEDDPYPVFVPAEGV